MLAAALAVAGCSAGRSGNGYVTPPDPPPVPRAKPIASVPAWDSAWQPAVGRRVHVITEGQSLYAVARLYGVEVRDLIEANRLGPPYKLAIGQHLAIPDAFAPTPAPDAPRQVSAVAQAAQVAPEPALAPSSPSLPSAHVVLSGETVYSIARRYQVDMADLVHLNAIPASYRISPGQQLRLPGGSPTLGSRGTTAAGLSTAANGKLGSAAADAAPGTQATPVVWSPSGQPAVAAMPPPEVTGPIPKSPPRAGGKFLWPVEGRVLLNYGPKQGGLHNDGINIEAPRGTPVLAAENGVVAYVGNELRGFGNLLLIKHADGWMTAYAHNEAILVGRGAQVKRGQTVARVGDSGSVLTPQLHFEVRRGTQAVDPAKQLGPRLSAQTM